MSAMPPYWDTVTRMHVLITDLRGGTTAQTAVEQLLHEFGEPLPGIPVTITYAGTERHDGEAPYLWVVAASDVSHAHKILRTLPSFQEWLRQNTPEDATEPDVEYHAEPYSHPGIPDFGAFHDLRKEQAAQLAPAPAPAAQPDAPADRAPALDDTPQRAYNRAAAFEGDSDTPAIVVADAAVHAYVEQGRLTVSVHLDTGDVPDALISPNGTVPITINVADTVVYAAD